MSGFDRSKLKATPIAKVKQQEAMNQAKRPKGGNDNNYLKINAGANIFRVFPPHPDGGGETYAEAKCVTFLEVTVPKRDATNNKVIEGEFEKKRKPIFNSKVHGNTDQDAVEEYIKFMKDRVFPDHFEGGFDDLYKELTNGQFGVKPSDSWVMYAKNSAGEIGLLEVRNSVKNGMTEIAAKYAGDDVQSPDPFTDPDDGIRIIITKTGQGLGTEYAVDLEQVRIDKFNTQLVPTPLTDEDLEIWSKKDSLYKMYVGAFKRSDWNYQIEGLREFDAKFAKKHGINGAFSYDEFLDILESIDAQIPQEEEKPKEEKPAPATTAKVTKKPATVAAPVKAAPVVKAKPTPKPAPVIEAEVSEEEEENQEETTELDETFAQEPGLVQKQKAAAAAQVAKPTATKPSVSKAAPVKKAAPVVQEPEVETGGDAEEEVTTTAPAVSAADRIAALRKRVNK